MALPFTLKKKYLKPKRRIMETHSNISFTMQKYNNLIFPKKPSKRKTKNPSRYCITRVNS
jgi:hypothetical protein